MTITPGRQIEHLTAGWFTASWTVDIAAGCGGSSATLDSAIDTMLGNLNDRHGTSLAGIATGADDAIGVPGDWNLPGEITYEPNRDYWIDSANDQQIMGTVSYKRVTSGLSTVTGLVVDFISNKAPADAISNIIRFRVATGDIQMSSDGGATWGPAKVVTGLATNEAVIVGTIIGSDLAVCYVRRTAAGLPAGDQQDTLTVASGQWAIGFMTNQGDPYYNTATPDLNIAVPVVYDWSEATPQDMLRTKWTPHIWPDPVQPTSAILNKWRVENTNPTGVNTWPNLSYSPYSTSDVDVYVNGILLINGTHYTVAGSVVTPIPAAIGYKTYVSDELSYRYFSV